MNHNPLADAMIVIKNAENVGKKECAVTRSDLIKNVLDIMEKTGYITGIKVGKRDITVSLNGKINVSKAINPRYSCKYTDFEKFEKRYLPAKDIGVIILSTSKGVISHKEAEKNKIGGKLLAYVY